MNKISVIIIVKDPKQVFQKTLESVKDFDEIVIVNTGTKESLDPFIHKFSNVKIFEKEFNGFGPVKQFAETKTSNSWLLTIDSDEVLSKEAIEKISFMPLNKNEIYSFPYKNMLYGKWIKTCGWYPDRQVSLYNKLKTGFSSDLVHEKVLRKNLKEQALKEPIFHYSYEGVSDLLDKMQKYSNLFAEKKRSKHSPFLFRAILSSIFTFFKSYFLQRGFLSGSEGFIISLYKSHVAFYKYLKCWELTKK